MYPRDPVRGPPCICGPPHALKRYVSQVHVSEVGAGCIRCCIEYAIDGVQQHASEGVKVVDACLIESARKVLAEHGNEVRTVDVGKGTGESESESESEGEVEREVERMSNGALECAVEGMGDGAHSPPGECADATAGEVVDAIDIAGEVVGERVGKGMVGFDDDPQGEVKRQGAGKSANEDVASVV